jgi:hypothetical protein
VSGVVLINAGGYIKENAMMRKLTLTDEAYDEMFPCEDEE